MSGTAGVSTQFSTATSATGAQLDGNFTALVNYANDPTNRNNYAGDTGTTNTIALTFAPAVAGYTTGLELTFKAAFTNSGPVQINANGLGAVNYLNPDGSALSSGQMQAGGMYKAVYNGTSFYAPSVFSSPATKAQQQTATASASFVTPSIQNQHPSAVKAWVNFDGTVAGTQTVTTNGFNVSTVVRTGTGVYSITFLNAFATTNYAWAGSVHGANAVVVGSSGSAKGTATILIQTSAISGGVLDSTQVCFIATGVLA